jgi:hypothetical protein
MGKRNENKLLGNQLGNVVSMVAKEDQIIWAIFGVFWAANALLLVALFNTGEIPDDKVILVVSIVGTLLSIIWFIIQRRAINWLRYYEILMGKLEKKLKIPNKLAMSPNKNELLFCKIVGKGIRVRMIMVWSGILSSVAWFSVFIIVLIRAKC